MKSPDSLSPETIQAILELIGKEPGLMADDIAKRLNVSIFDIISLTETLLSAGVIEFSD